MLFCRQFAFCQYPMLISMGTKMQILQLDAKRQMEHKLKVRPLFHSNRQFCSRRRACHS